jgi:RNA polymerase sigma-70 factor (ECF subfamily)
MRGGGDAASSGVDRALVQRAQAGEQAALETLCRLTWKPVYRLMARSAESSTEAEDLTQTVFLRVLTSLPAYEERGLPFEAYLFRAARNLLADRWRAGSNRLLPLEVLEDHPSVEPGPEQAADVGEQRRILGAAFNQLSSRHQQVLRLRLVDGRSSLEVADLLGSTGPAVRQMQVRAVAALRDAVNRITGETTFVSTSPRKDRLS